VARRRLTASGSYPESLSTVGYRPVASIADNHCVARLRNLSPVWEAKKPTVRQMTRMPATARIRAPFDEMRVPQAAPITSGAPVRETPASHHDDD
jgi:hypothetical protein